LNRVASNISLYEFLTKEISLPCIAYNTSVIRVFNALPSDAKVNVFLGDDLLASELEYKQFGFYIPILEAETYNLRVFVSGKSDNLIIDTKIELYQLQIETLAIVGTLQNPSILRISGEPRQEPYIDKSVIRYANLSKSNVVINVISNKNVIQSGPLNINEYNKYSPLDPGLYEFEFVNQKDNFKTSVEHILKNTRIYTFYLVGTLDSNSPMYLSYPLELVISVDLATVIKHCPPDMKRYKE
jgi:hypothetical protein